jgi:hypothetical protein
MRLIDDVALTHSLKIKDNLQNPLFLKQPLLWGTLRGYSRLEVLNLKNQTLKSLRFPLNVNQKHKWRVQLDPTSLVTPQNESYMYGNFTAPLFIRVYDGRGKLAVESICHYMRRSLTALSNEFFEGKLGGWLSP